MSAPETAWPFLIGRTKDEDYRLVVVPAFMTDPSQAAALRSGTDGEPGTVLTREIRLTPAESVTAIYRVHGAAAADYGIPGDEPLTDSHGRPILLTEGFVLRDAPLALAPKMPEAALDRVRPLVAPAFREFWARGSTFKRHVSQAFPLPSEASPGPRSRPEPVSEALPPPGRAPAPVSSAAPKGRRRHYALIVYVLGSVVLVVVVILIAWQLLNSGR